LNNLNEIIVARIEVAKALSAIIASQYFDMNSIF